MLAKLISTGLLCKCASGRALIRITKCALFYVQFSLYFIEMSLCAELKRIDPVMHLVKQKYVFILSIAPKCLDFKNQELFFVFNQKLLFSQFNK